MDSRNIRRIIGRALLIALATLTVGAQISFAAPANPSEENRTMITTDYLNVREEPSTKARILGVLNIGTIVEGTPEGKWFKTEYLGHTVYVHGNYLKNAETQENEAVEKETQKTDIRYTTDWLNVRTGPDTSYEILDVLRPGTRVEGIQEGDWFKTEYRNRTAYVHADYLRTETAEAGEWMTFTATAYDPSVGDTTRMGTPARIGVVAVDPTVIPLGSTVEIEGYGVFSAEDTGSAIKGNKIDIFVASYSEAIQFGVQTVRVRVLD